MANDDTIQWCETCECRVVQTYPVLMGAELGDPIRRLCMRCLDGIRETGTTIIHVENPRPSCPFEYVVVLPTLPVRIGPPADTERRALVVDLTPGQVALLRAVGFTLVLERG